MLNPVVLVILDGWGYRQESHGNAILLADTPHMDHLTGNFSHCLLGASGEAVGLPPGQMGNSEVGHLNLGAGRIVLQDFTRISCAIEEGSFFENPVLKEALQKADRSGGNIHLIGLLSDGGVHSHVDHLEAILDLADKQQVGPAFVHAILDGRDTPPASARPHIERFYRRSLERRNGYIATICGRYYAMDRDRRWERTAKAYRAYVYGEGNRFSDPCRALEEAYRRGETDEFVQPVVITDDDGAALAPIRDGDSVIFFNFRPDRVRQISHALHDEHFTCFQRGPAPPLPSMTTLTEYERDLYLPMIFPPDYPENTLGQIFSDAGLPQLRVAETEKYAHVTFFFNGGREKIFPGEERILVPSPGVATYDLQPEMSAAGVADIARRAIVEGRHRLLVVNFANPDMVGHTGILEAAIKAIETVDRQLSRVTEAALGKGWRMIICADHGNAEEMIDSGGGRHTAHTVNPVPCILPGCGPVKLRQDGRLADIAPTILELAGLPQPEEMTGRSLLI
ncbi:MAG TPA: 2,3-bisphosphoglycerate-independent phosphoglycerate mutase [Firmicutes bacterium]|jgi:2,3-bisphosphoglycerate-independent phosphoglycerate mutase|nr:2,3-bisphosphoglycerate-independent phosphoglycerate mutase [Bacillota bacterium]